MTSIGEATTPSAGLEVEDELHDGTEGDETDACQKCGEEFHVDDGELDEDGYCSGCVEGNRDYEERYRYFHSVSR